MSALVLSEMLKVRTTRIRFVYPLVILVVVGLSAGGTVGEAADSERGTVDFQRDLVDVATPSALLAFILGVAIVTSEFRHGTITPTFLATPVRERVLAAKALVATLGGLVFAAFALVVVAAVAVPWLLARGHDLQAGEPDVWLHALRIVLAAAVWGLLGAAVGMLVHSQIGGIVGALVWLLIVENIIVAVIGLTRYDGAAHYLPGQALDGIASADAGKLGFWAALGVSLAYVAAFGALGTLRTRRRDIT